MSKQKATPEDEVAVLRAATREAHEAIQALREVMRDFAKLKEDIKHGSFVTAEMLVEQAVKIEMKKLGEATEKAIDNAMDAVDKRFDQVADILLGEDKRSKRQGRKSIADFAREKREKLDAEQA